MLRRSAVYLERAGCASPRVDAERLLAHALGLERIELYMQLDRPLISSELAAARSIVARRAKREPLQYILGRWGFRRLDLLVDQRALIPRPETEILVERALALISGREAPRVLDVGTGSGAIALAIADEHPGSHVIGLDVSADALALAAENVARTALAVELVRGDLRDGLPIGPFDLVVSNPPYVDPADEELLDPEVRDWEPQVALFGTELATEIARQALTRVVPGGALALEVDDRQATGVADALRRLGFTAVRVTDDLAGRPRVVEGTV
ncbi:MAG: peptide chain release factor N(5)-glutamine methyltransferase [Gaiella sp.]